jgi:hypothetical protein
MQNETVATVPDAPFKLSMVSAFSTFKDGKPKSIPYLIDGLLPSGAFSVLAGKPKRGKSSLARYEAVCVLKGQPFLGRDTQRGEVLLVSLEDPLQHVDNCLGALGYDQRNDSHIHIVTKLAPRIDDSIAAIEEAISNNKSIRLVIVDTLAKLLRSDDLNDYAKVMLGVEKISALARRHPHLHIQGLAHAKKLKTDDPFDSLLGSTALRGEPDTTIALYDDRGQRLIATETRIGRSIPPTLLSTSIVDSAGAHVVSDFRLDVPFADWQKTHVEKPERQRKVTHEERIIAFLQERQDHAAKHSDVLEEVEGKTSLKLGAINNLTERGVVTVTGTKQSKTDPLVLHLNESALQANDFINKFAAAEEVEDYDAA